MLKKAAAVLAVVLCLVNVHATRAEPGPVVNWLMNEPASLFDIGMVQLSVESFRWTESKKISDLREQLQVPIGFSPLYSFEDNRIHLIAYVIGKVGIDSDSRKAVCRDLLDFMSLQALVDPATGQYNFGATASGFSLLFAHIGYVNKSQPNEYMTRLDKVFVLKASVGAAPEITICQRALMSNRVYFEE